MIKNEVSVDTESQEKRDVLHDDEVELCLKLHRHKTQVLHQFGDMIVQIRAKKKEITQNKMRILSEIRKLKKKKTLMEDDVFAFLIAEKILKNAKCMVSLAGCSSYRFMTFKGRMHTFKMQESDEVKNLLSSQAQLLTSTHDSVNVMLRTARLKVISIDSVGVVLYTVI